MCFYVLVLRVTCHTGVSVYNVVPCLMRYMFVPCLMYPHSCTMPHITRGTNIMWYEALYMTPVKQCLIWSHVQCLISHVSCTMPHMESCTMPHITWGTNITWGIVHDSYTMPHVIFVYHMRHCVQIRIYIYIYHEALCTNIYIVYKYIFVHNASCDIYLYHIMSHDAWYKYGISI